MGNYHLRGSYAAWRGQDPKWPTNDANGRRSDARARFPKNDAILLGFGFPASGEREKAGSLGREKGNTRLSDFHESDKVELEKKAFMAQNTPGCDTT